MSFHKSRDENEAISAWQREASTAVVCAGITIFLGVFLLWVRIIETLNRQSLIR